MSERVGYLLEVFRAFGPDSEEFQAEVIGIIPAEAAELVAAMGLAM